MSMGIVVLDAAGKSTIPGVIMLGLGMVFVGLICIIFLCKLMGWIFGAFKGNKTEKPQQAAQSAPASAPVGAAVENRGEILAAVSAAIAEELGTDVSALRIISFKKI